MNRQRCSEASVCRPISQLSAAAIVAMLAVACGGDAARNDVAAMYVDVAADDGLTVQRDCVADVLDAMSDTDVDRLADAGLEGDTVLSESGYAVLAEVANLCVDVDQYIDKLIKEVNENRSQPVDPGCVRARLADTSSVDQVDRQAGTAITICSEDADV